MIEYLILAGIGIGAAVGEYYIHRLLRKSEEEHERAIEENTRAHERLNTTLSNPEDMSRLVAHLTDKR